MQSPLFLVAGTLASARPGTSLQIKVKLCLKQARKIGGVGFCKMLKKPKDLMETF